MSLFNAIINHKPSSILSSKSLGDGRSLIKCFPTTMNEPHEWDKSIYEEEVIAVDFETNGLDVLSEDFKIIGVGLASSNFPNGMYTRDVQLCHLLKGKKLIMHNSNFDSRIMDKFITKDYSLLCDTAIAYRMIGSEDNSMRHGLKPLSQEVLGWDEAYESELYEWLDANNLKAKGMWQAPDHILGKYCAMDAQATLALYNVWKDNYVDRFPVLTEAMELSMDLQGVINEAFFRGMAVNKTALVDYICQLTKDVIDIRTEIYNNLSVQSFITTIYNNKRQELIAKEPPMYTKTGKISARYNKWNEKVEAITFVSAEELFNLNSKKQLIEFFTSQYKHEVFVDDRGYNKVRWYVGDKSFVSDATPSGNVKVDKSVLPKLGEIGVLLNRMNGIIKLRGYAQAMRDSLKGGIHNTDMRPWATLNGRPAGGGVHHSVNILQIPKVEGYLDCLVARPEHVFIEMDYNSLEPTILAETSKDATYVKLYGDKNYPNDSYIELMSRVPMFKDKVKALGYPSLDSISVIKKEMKKQRSMIKPVQLGLGFGMGTAKLKYQLEMQGHKLSLEEVQELVDTYKHTYKGLFEYQDKLQQEVSDNGYFLNGLGMPRCLNSKTVKDVLNGQSQGTGNLIQMKHSYEINRLRKERDVMMYPIVASFYDELVWEVHMDHIDRAKDIFNEALAIVNEWLGGDFPIEGEVEITRNFSGFKL